jgi:hypothetical protein
VIDRTFPLADAAAAHARMEAGDHVGKIVLTEKRKVAALLAALAAIGVPDDGIQKRPDFEAPERPGI